MSRNSTLIREYQIEYREEGTTTTTTTRARSTKDARRKFQKKNPKATIAKITE